jgi:hypothetical protein
MNEEWQEEYIPQPAETSPMEPQNIVTTSSGLDVQILTPSMQEQEVPVLECIELAKQKWLADNPGSTELGWELVSDFERDEYLEEQMSKAGYTKSIVNGFAHYE